MWSGGCGRVKGRQQRQIRVGCRVCGGRRVEADGRCRLMEAGVCNRE